MERRISLFSGIEFNVDPSQGLNGTCDFILARSPHPVVLATRPVMMIVEAKNENIKSGLGQCVGRDGGGAAVQRTRAGRARRRSTARSRPGASGRFLKLDGTTLFVDRPEYYLEPVGKILGILLHCVGGDPATAGAAA